MWLGPSSLYIFCEFESSNEIEMLWAGKNNMNDCASRIRKDSPADSAGIITAMFWFFFPPILPTSGLNPNTYWDI